MPSWRQLLEVLGMKDLGMEKKLGSNFKSDPFISSVSPPGSTVGEKSEKSTCEGRRTVCLYSEVSALKLWK